VRLERIISERNRAEGRDLLRWLGGEPQQQLFDRPFGVTWHGDDLLVTDPGAGKLFLIDRAGSISSTREGLFSVPIDVAACGDSIYVTDSRAGTVVELEPDLQLRRRLELSLERPTGIECNEGRLYVVDTARHVILVVDPDGDRTIGKRGSAPGEFNYPTAVAIHENSLWIGDTLNSRAQKLDISTGEHLRTVGELEDGTSQLPRIKGIGVDAAGNLWVSDAHLDRVLLFSTDGAVLMDLGQRGTAPGEFSFPAGIAAHTDGRVAVVDSLNRRVQIFSLINDDGDAKHEEIP
jgi:DNA-binding beta-propeller fold protein YncE